MTRFIASQKKLNFSLFLLLFSFSSLSAFGQKKNKTTPTDLALTTPSPYNYTSQKIYTDITIQTYYVEMRDGVKIAVDVYLPKGLKSGTKIPTILHQTRYWRSPELRAPFKWFSDGLLGTMGKAIKEFVFCGYAIVNVDARGSGASFGNRPHPWHENETKDGAEIVDWIIKQPWSNQIVGSMGASYSGTTANFLLVNQHPNVKAIIDLYSLFDVYRDISFPGGVFHRHFVNKWGFYNSRLDADLIPRKGIIPRILVKGVRRVKVKHKNKVFRAAIKDHKNNQSVANTAKGVAYRDDSPPSQAAKNGDVFSPHSYMEQINGSGAAIYLYSGWFDGAYQYASIRKFLNYTNPKNKLTIGPWEHGGNFNCSPEHPCEAGFSHVGEFLKFFDYHLKGIDNGLYNEPRIHYFTMTEEKWKNSDVWPPLAETVPFYFQEKNVLSNLAPNNLEGQDTYVVDTTVGTGRFSRWVSLIGELKTQNVYPDRAERDKKLLLYESSILSEDQEITGHGFVHLYLKTSSPDGNFHVYLEEVDEQGKVYYITEGLVRGIHQIATEKTPPYKDVVPYRSYKREDSRPMDTEGVNYLHFDLLPVSYLVPKGHKIRVSLAGADQDHFAVMHKSIPTWQVQRNQQFPSRVELPLMPRK
jgi:uncharacterized protein